MAYPEEQKMVPASQAGSDERRDMALGRLKQVQMGIAPTNLSEGFQLAEMLAKSTLVPKDFQGNPGNVLIAIQMGIEIGLAPMQALQSIAVINGRPSIWGDGLLALVVSSGLLQGNLEETFKDGVASCAAKRKGWPDKVTRTFSIEDAKKARLWTKAGPWQEYPERMLQMRARAFCLRDVFPDVLRGLAVAEEQRDAAPVVGGPAIDVPPDPNARMHSELGCTNEEFAAVVELWDFLKTPPAQRLVQAKQYSGRVGDLLDALRPVSVQKATDQVVVQTVAPAALSPRTKKRHARAKAEAHAAPAPPAAAMSPEEQAESLVAALDPKAVCEHGVDVKVAAYECADCRRIALELDAEAAAQETTVQIVPDPEPKPAETPQEYSARRKRELAELNSRPLPNVAPKDTNPL